MLIGAYIFDIMNENKKNDIDSKKTFTWNYIRL